MAEVHCLFDTRRGILRAYISRTGRSTQCLTVTGRAYDAALPLSSSPCQSRHPLGVLLSPRPFLVRSPRRRRMSGLVYAIFERHSSRPPPPRLLQVGGKELLSRSAGSENEGSFEWDWSSGPCGPVCVCARVSSSRGAIGVAAVSRGSDGVSVTTMRVLWQHTTR